MELYMGGVGHVYECEPVCENEHPYEHVTEQSHGCEALWATETKTVEICVAGCWRCWRFWGWDRR